MNNFTGSFVKKCFLGLFCVLFFLGSAAPALCGPKKKKKRNKVKSHVTTEVATETATESATGTVTEAAAEISAVDDIDVYAEGAYTTGDDGDLTVYIYADINVGNLVSFGVKLNYAAAKLENPVAEKNEDVWYMGDGTEAGNHFYMDPDISTAGQIIFIGGMLDESDLTARVTGARVLLGKAIFSRTDATKTEDPKADPGGPEGYFGISLELGRPDPPTTTFDNFVHVSTDGTVITVKDDSVVFQLAEEIYKLGDADKNGTVDAMDLLKIRDMIPLDEYSCYADGDRNEVVDAMDMLWIRDHMD